jgi:hypothetical protein
MMAPDTSARAKRMTNASNAHLDRLAQAAHSSG